MLFSIESSAPSPVYTSVVVVAVPTHSKERKKLELAFYCMLYLGAFILCTLVERVLNTHFAANINLFCSMNYLTPTVLDICYASGHFRYLNLRIICIVLNRNSKEYKNDCNFYHSPESFQTIMKNFIF